MNPEKFKEVLSPEDMVFLLEEGPLGSETLLVVSDDPDIENKIERVLSDEDEQALMIVSHREFKMMKVRGKRIV